jgi:hypothetical protein
MTRTKLCIVLGVVLAVLAFTPRVSHAQYTGGQPPIAGPIDNGPQNGPPAGPSGGGPATVKGIQFTPHHSSGAFLGLSWTDVAGILGAIGVLGLLWLLFAWKRRNDEDEEDGVAGATA